MFAACVVVADGGGGRLPHEQSDVARADLVGDHLLGAARLAVGQGYDRAAPGSLLRIERLEELGDLGRMTASTAQVQQQSVAVREGAVGQLVAQRADPASTIIPYSTPDKAVRALSAKKVDLVIHDAPVLWRIMAENPAAGNTVVPKLLTKESLAWAVRRGDTALLKKANAALAKWRSNGTLDRTLRTYMPRYDVIERM